MGKAQEEMEGGEGGGNDANVVLKCALGTCFYF